MREIFEGQLPVDETSMDALLKRAFVVLDTNVLLDLYRYSQDTSAEFLDILESIADRLWMPHHVGWEFLRRRATLRASTTENHDIRLKALADLRAALKKTGGLESHVGGDSEEQEFLNALQSYIARLKNHRKTIRDWASGPDDQLLESILDLYDGKTGQAPPDAWYSDRQLMGKIRYEQGIPPGYMDASKTTNRFGDFYIWSQCIERAKTVRQPLLFVTRDSKEDWWEREGNEVLGAHTELLQEFWDETGQRVILMNPTAFYDAFAPEPASDQPADFTARDEIVATQAAEQKRGSFVVPMPLVPDAHRIIATWLANLQPPVVPEINVEAILQAAQAAAEFTQHDRDISAIDDDDYDEIGVPGDEEPNVAADDDTDG